ncbi:hypothetical protein [Roseovarius sp. M141]|uniref:hypothetical protein n=1 Tax=Roseovarius sp. M141 TaxID=2583806 RepID=UPI0020CE3ACF|nr:hypothetical protein [Roseovarius sp. M141]
MQKYTLISLLIAVLSAASSAAASTICTVIMDGESREIAHEEGDCDSRVTPASTFEIALALMAYDAGIVQDAHTPRLPFREGYSRSDTDNFDYANGWGCYVGWAQRDDTTLVFAHLLQDETRQPVSPGVRARIEILDGFVILHRGFYREQTHTDRGYHSWGGRGIADGFNTGAKSRRPNLDRAEMCSLSGGVGCRDKRPRPRRSEP